MKVCHVTNLLPYYHEGWGGAEQAVYRIAKMLAKEGIENVIAATKPKKQPDEKKEEFKFYSIPVMQDILGDKFGGFFKRPFDPLAYLSIYRLFRKVKPDIVHLHNFGNIGFGAILAAKKLKIPVVFSLYDYWCFCPIQTLIKQDYAICTKFHGPQCLDCLNSRQDMLQKTFISMRQRMFDSFLFQKVDKFIALSDFVSGLLQKYGIRKEKISVVRLPMEKLNLRNERIKKNSILFVGWIVPRKGLHVIINAMPKILKEVPNAKLYVDGQEDPYEEVYKKEIESKIKEKQLKKHVFLFKKQEKGKIQKLIAKSEVLVVPEQWQNMSPLIVIECMMFGKGIVASNIGGIPELIQNKKTGLLAEPGSSEDFARKIIWALKHKKEMDKIRKNARKVAIRLFDEKIAVKKLVGVYSSLINSE